MSESRLAPPHVWITLTLAVFGVGIPLAALVVELHSHVSMALGIDPLPSLPHAILVGWVPVCLACALLALHAGRSWDALRVTFWLDRGLGIAQGIALGFAIALWPLTWIGAWVAGMGWVLLLGPDGDNGAKILIPLSWLALSPALAFIAGVIARWRWRRRHPSARAGRFRWPLLGLVALGLVELPSLALHLLVARDWQVPIPIPIPESALLRAHDLGLDSVGLLGPISGGRFWQSRTGPALSEQQLLRQTGRIRAAFGPLPLPGRDSVDYAVAGEGIGLDDRARADFRTELPMTAIEWTESRIQAEFHPDFGSAYLEWTFVIRNHGMEDQEARAQIQLPPGASVSRATLWVDGVPREAAVGKRSTAVAAYQKVVRGRRDPLLVTSQGVDRVFLNAFPIPAEAAMKFRLGISLPLLGLEPGHGAQFLPRLGARSFSTASDLRHEVRWKLEPGSQLRWTQLELGSPNSMSPGEAEVRFTDDELRRGVIGIVRSKRPPKPILRIRDLRSSPLPGLQVSTTQVPAAAELPVLLVVDGSRALANHAEALADWLEAEHRRPLVGVVLAGEARTLLAPSEAAARLRRAHWAGGSDNEPSLRLAASLIQEEPAEVIWIRGPQLFEGHDLHALWTELCPDENRCSWTELAVTPSPDPFDGLRSGAAWLALPFTGDLAADLARIDRDWARGIRGYRVERTRSQEARGTGTEPAAIHTARLVAREEILRAGHQGLDRAVDLARRYELVTPLEWRCCTRNRFGVRPIGARDPSSPARRPGCSGPWSHRDFGSRAVVAGNRRPRFQSPAAPSSSPWAVYCCAGRVTGRGLDCARIAASPSWRTQDGGPMGKASVTQAMNVPVETTWNLVADFGNTSWMPGGAQARLEGDGPGMARLIQAGPDKVIREQLESVDGENRTLVYTIPDTDVPFPVSGYRSTMQVDKTTEGSDLTWSCEFQPNGTTDGEAQAAIEQMYGLMTGWIRDTLQG